MSAGTSLTVQELRLCAPNVGLIPSQGIKNLYAGWCSQKNIFNDIIRHLLYAHTLLGATGYKVDNSHNILVLGFLQQHLKAVDTRRLDEELN